MNLRPRTARQANAGVYPAKGCSLRFYIHKLGFWTELIDKVYNSERDRWQTYPEIASLEEQHMVDCINCNNHFSCFDRNWQRPSKIF